jgi:hypothetical protein
VFIADVAEITEQLGRDPLVMGAEAIFIAKACANQRYVR